MMGLRRIEPCLDIAYRIVGNLCIIIWRILSRIILLENSFITRDNLRISGIFQHRREVSLHPMARYTLSTAEPQNKK